jgi:hypothetical protein
MYHMIQKRKNKSELESPETYYKSRSTIQRFNMEKEITKEEALENFFSDEELSDITLKSSIDGEQLLAHRNLVGARSRVFRQMLYGNFAESSRPVIEIQYSGKAIKNIRDYI